MSTADQQFDGANIPRRRSELGSELMVEGSKAARGANVVNITGRKHFPLKLVTA